MNIPRFLLGASLLFWGWQTGWWLAAVPMTLIYETSHFLKWRWNLSTQDFRQTSHICTILLAVVVIYLFVSERSLHLIFDFFQWLPLICFPLLIAQAYSLRNGIDLRALLFFSDRGKNREQYAIVFDATYPYFAICLLSASAANVRGFTFYLAMFVLASIALWNLRSPRFSIAKWISLMLIAGSLGVVGHIGLHQMHLAMERSTMRWMRGFYHHQTNPQQTSTAIGDIGSVKLSNEILFRVKTDSGKPPQLLKQASYSKYVSGMWVASDSEFVEIKPTSEDNWELAESTGNLDRVTVRAINQEQDLLNLPDGSVRVENLPAKTLEKNQYGTVKISEIQPGLVSYRVYYDKNGFKENLPTENDLQIPVAEKIALNTIISELNLREKTPSEILLILESFFNTEFDYSLKLARRRHSITPLSAFLLEHRLGHCEYFATATTLLLRSLGIPARYTVGYSVDEYSNWEKQYIVRGRNAHAWTLVYLNGVWQEFDTTPADWRQLENDAVSAWSSIFDFFSWMGFKLAQAIAYVKSFAELKRLWWLIVPLIFLGIRWFRDRKQGRKIKMQNIAKRSAVSTFIGEDSEIYFIEKTLNELGIIRERSETFKDWIERLEEHLPTSDLVTELLVIAELHYAYRFDPQGISEEERKRLKSCCDSWLAKFSTPTDS